MSINKDQIKYLSLLSRMDIQESEINDVEEKLTKIIDFVDHLFEFVDLLQKNTKSTERGMYIVPKVIE